MRSLLSVLLSVFFILFISVTEARATCNSSAGNLCCKGWLNGNYAGAESADYDGGNSRDSSRDNVGVKGQCHDYFPTWGERTKFERTSEDPFNAMYEVTRQYCWARFVLDGDNPNCGGPKMRWCRKFIFYYPCGWNWDNPNYISWGDTKRKSVSIDELYGSECKTVTLIGAFNYSEICLAKPNQEYKHGGKNATNKNKVCAYYQPTFIISSIIGRDEYKKNLIGCVDAPLAPIPNVFNTTIPSGTAPWVDIDLSVNTLIKKYGSKFDQPTIVMRAEQFDFETDNSIKQDLVLRYRFEGDDYIYPTASTPFANAPICGKFDKLETKYCAYIPIDQVDKVCVCYGDRDADECMNTIPLGCVSRPSMDQSDISVNGKYTLWQDELGDLFPAVNVFLTRNSDKSRLSLPPEKEPMIITEYYKTPGSATENDDGSMSLEYLMSRGAGNLYGLDFTTIIPQFDPNEKIKTVKAVNAQVNNASYQCPVCTKSSDAEFPDSPMFGGTRDASLCCPSSIAEEDKEARCKIPPHPKNCPVSPNLPAPLSPDPEAENAVCPGVYQGPSETSNEAEKICVLYEDPWNNFEVDTSPFCIDMPLDCSPVDLPSASSGFAIWGEAKQNETTTGTCDSSYGFINRQELDLSCPDCTPSSGDSGQTHAITAQKNFKKIQDTYSTLQTLSSLLDTNVSISAMTLLSEMRESEVMRYITKRNLTPTRQCTGNIFYKDLKNSCSRIDNCKPITKASPANGNMYTSDASNLWKNSNSNEDIRESYTTGDRSISIYTTSSEIEGRCADGYEENPNGKPIIQCISRYSIKSVLFGNNERRLITQSWAGPTNPCVAKKTE